MIPLEILICLYVIILIGLVIEVNLSKSKYIQGVNCEKELWLSCYKKEEAEDMGTDVVLANVTKVGE